MQIDARLRPGDFYRERHRLIFQAMLSLKEKSVPEPVDVLTVCEELERQGVLEEAGGTAYVHSLPGLVPSAPNAPHYARIVKAHALRRELIDAAREIQDQTLRVRRRHRASCSSRPRRGSSGSARRTAAASSSRSSEILHGELDKLEQISREGVSLSGTPSGFKDLDDLTGGFQPGNLIVLAARPAMGKSALVTNMAENAAVDHGKPVALFSLEMSETELAQRFIASQAKLNGDDLRKGRVNADRWPKVIQATEKLAKAPLFVDDSSDIGILELRAKARRLHNRSELGLLIVDYLQLMRPEDPASAASSRSARSAAGSRSSRASWRSR